jgi:hypothetical protein
LHRQLLPPAACAGRSACQHALHGRVCCWEACIGAGFAADDADWVVAGDAQPHLVDLRAEAYGITLFLCQVHCRHVKKISPPFEVACYAQPNISHKPNSLW